MRFYFVSYKYLCEDGDLYLVNQRNFLCESVQLICLQEIGKNKQVSKTFFCLSIEKGSKIKEIDI